MQVIHIGNEPQAKRWLELIAADRRASSVARVDATDQNGSTAGGLPAYPTMASALSSTSADTAVLHDGNVAAACDALVQGMSVIVADGSGLEGGDVQRIRSACAEGNGKLTVASAGRYASVATTVAGYFASGRFGSIGHIGCIDQRGSGRTASVTNPSAQLTAFGIHDLCSIGTLFGVSPVSIMARVGSGAADNSSWTEAFVEYDKEIRVQYFGTTRRGEDNHRLWIEGTKGSMRTDGSSVWWRKRGWRFFVPIKLWRRVPTMGEQAVLASAIASNQGSAGQDSQNQLAALALVVAARESRGLKRPVRIAELLRTEA